LRAPAALTGRLDALGALLPGVDFAELAWRAPGVLRLSRAETASAVTALRFALPPALDLLPLLTRAPHLLLCARPGDAARAGQARALAPVLSLHPRAESSLLQQERLRALFPSADIAAMIAVEPGVLLSDLSAGAKLLRHERGCTEADMDDAELGAYVSTPAGLHTLLRCAQQAQKAQRAAERSTLAAEESSAADAP
jgi:hypothetical protein